MRPAPSQNCGWSCSPSLIRVSFPPVIHLITNDDWRNMAQCSIIDLSPPTPPRIGFNPPSVGGFFCQNFCRCWWVLGRWTIRGLLAPHHGAVRDVGKGEELSSHQKLSCGFLSPIPSTSDHGAFTRGASQSAINAISSRLPTRSAGAVLLAAISPIKRRSDRVRSRSLAIFSNDVSLARRVPCLPSQHPTPALSDDEQVRAPLAPRFRRSDEGLRPRPSAPPFVL